MERNGLANMNVYEAKPAARSEEPLLLGMIGPPGGGKTLSALKLAQGIKSVRGGRIIAIDTEGGRSRKYSDLIPFDIVEMPIGARSDSFLEAIKAQLPSNPAAIVVDSMSDEHDQYLAWHDEMVPKMGGNEWAAWAKPSAARKQLITGILKIKVPLIFTFRAREKTKQDGKKIINIGWQPVAPLEIVHTLDLTCILPPRADGVPVWKSDKVGEDFIIKLPNYLAPHIRDGQALNEDMGAAFAKWARGDTASAAAPVDKAAPPTQPDKLDGGAAEQSEGERINDLDRILETASYKGTAALQDAWKALSPSDQKSLESALRGRHKPTAVDEDARAAT
jgi:hypothetical protein